MWNDEPWSFFKTGEREKSLKRDLEKLSGAKLFFIFKLDEIKDRTRFLIYVIWFFGPNAISFLAASNQKIFSVKKKLTTLFHFFSFTFKLDFYFQWVAASVKPIFFLCKFSQKLMWVFRFKTFSRVKICSWCNTNKIITFETGLYICLCLFICFVELRLYLYCHPSFFFFQIFIPISDSDAIYER